MMLWPQRLTYKARKGYNSMDIELYRRHVFNDNRRSNKGAERANDKYR